MALACAHPAGCRATQAPALLSPSHAAAPIPCWAEPYDGERVRFASRVAAVGQGWVELERALPYDMRLEWQVGGRRPCRAGGLGAAVPGAVADVAAAS